MARLRTVVFNSAWTASFRGPPLRFVRADRCLAALDTLCGRDRCPRRCVLRLTKYMPAVPPRRVGGWDKYKRPRFLRGFGHGGPSRPRRGPRPSRWRGGGPDAKSCCGVPALLVVTDERIAAAILAWGCARTGWSRAWAWDASRMRNAHDHAHRHASARAPHTHAPSRTQPSAERRAPQAPARRSRQGRPAAWPASSRQTRLPAQVWAAGLDAASMARRGQSLNTN